MDGSSEQEEEPELVALVEAGHDYAAADHADLVAAIAEGNYWGGHYDQGLEQLLEVLSKVLGYAGCILAEDLVVDHCSYFDVDEEGHCDHLWHHLLGDRYYAPADMEVVDIHTEDFVEDIQQPVDQKEQAEGVESYIAAHQPLRSERLGVAKCFAKVVVEFQI